MPKPRTINAAAPLSGTAGPQLAARFAKGLRDAGILLSPTNALALSMTMMVATPPNVQGIAAGHQEGLDWTSAQPAAGDRKLRLRDSLLSMDVSLTANPSHAVAWIASVKCTVRTNDPGALAEDLGASLGRVLGRNIERKPI